MYITYILYYDVCMYIYIYMINIIQWIIPITNTLYVIYIMNVMCIYILHTHYMHNIHDISIHYIHIKSGVIIATTGIHDRKAH